jgi:hypothetical protein
MQTLGRLGTLDSQQATIEATLRLKELGEGEACTQAGIVIDLIFGLWEPIQAVRCGLFHLLVSPRASLVYVKVYVQLFFWLLSHPQRVAWLQYAMIFLRCKGHTGI